MVGSTFSIAEEGQAGQLFPILSSIDSFVKVEIWREILF